MLQPVSTHLLKALARALAKIYQRLLGLAATASAVPSFVRRHRLTRRRHHQALSLASKLAVAQVRA